MSDRPGVLIVAHQTAATPALLEVVAERAARGPARFHLVVPQQAHGLDRLATAENGGAEEAEQVLAEALPALSHAVGEDVSGHVGVPEPLMATEDAVNAGDFSEIIISTLPLGISRWLKLDLVSKARGIGLPVTHVLAGEREPAPAA
jgi:hypothetical protein